MNTDLSHETKITWLRNGGPESIKGLRFVRLIDHKGADAWLPGVHNYLYGETLAFSTDEKGRVVRVWFILACPANLVDGLTDEFIADEYGGVPVRPYPIEVCRLCEPPATDYVPDPTVIKREQVLRAPSIANWRAHAERRRAALIELARDPSPPKPAPPPPPAPKRSLLARLIGY